MMRQISRWNSGEEPKSRDSRGMVAVGEMPALDREFEELLQRAADFQKLDSGCGERHINRVGS
jgi:carbamoylphosphate synthase large subunit